MLKNVKRILKTLKKCQKFKKVTGPTDRRTDGPTYQPTDQGVESRARDKK